jgi:hypothetical protein
MADAWPSRAKADRARRGFRRMTFGLRDVVHGILGVAAR